MVKRHRLVTSWELALRSENKSDSTIEHYTRDADRFLRAAKIEGAADITADKIREYALGFGKTHKDKTTREAVLAIKRFCQWLYDEGEVKKNPAVNVKLPKFKMEPQEAYSKADIKKLLSVCSKRSAVGCRDYALILFLFDTGVRVGELCSIEADGVRLDSDGAEVTVLGKTGYRDVPLGPQVTEALDRYMRRWPVPETGPLWLGAKGQKPLGRSGVFQVVKRLCKEAGVENLGVHAFRRAAAIYAKRNGGQDSDIMENMGWKTLVMLQHYTGSQKKKLAKKAFGNYSPAAHLDLD